MVGSRFRRPGRAAGFTLLELIIVVAVIGILAAIVMPNLKDVPRRTAENVLKTNLHTMRQVIDEYKADKGGYPTSLDALVEDGYLRAIPIDPITKSDSTWLVEYEEFDAEERPAETDQEDDQPGIWNVRSGAPGVSMDGSAYSEW